MKLGVCVNRAGKFRCLCALLALVCSSRAHADARPNVLFILTDDHRADTIAAYGNSHISTPNMDRLAARGFSFRRNYCMGSPHGAVCVPSRAMMMTGRSYLRIPLDLAGTMTLPLHLRTLGYTTFITGKWHNEAPSLLHAFARGHAIMMGGMSNHEEVPLVDIAPEGELVNHRISSEFSSEIFADAAIDFLTTAPKDAPFFCYVPFTAPHDPRMPPPEYREKYYKDRPPLPPNFLPQHPFDNGRLLTRDENLAAWPRTDDVIRDQLAEYYGLIEHLDAQIGRVLDALAASPFADNTYIVFAADQGIALGSHGLLGKQNVYEHSMRALLIVAGPGIPHGETRALTYLFDVVPTLCELLGVDPLVPLDGASLVPIWRGEQASLRDALFLAYEDAQRAVVESRWKLIRYPLVDYTQLFDLENDPHELHNLAETPEHADRVQSLLARLAEEQTRYGDTAPLTVEHPMPREVDLTGLRGEHDPWQPAWILQKYFGN
jgi:arylsulfatase A-like enzyme